MKHTLPILALVTIAIPSALPAAVPLRWTVETSRAQVAQFEAYRGETLNLEATMQSYGSPLAMPVQPSLYWQTNGMGAAWWTAPATASGNVLRATWSPTNDCGGTVYNCFIGGPDSTYRAAFRLRMLPSPGFTPNHIPLPTVKAESDPVFSAWLATNEFSSAGVDTNAVLGLITSATNGLATAADLTGHVPARAETVGTDMLWTDATGVVWSVVREYGPWTHSFEGDASVKWWFWGEDQNGETGWVGGARVGGRAGMPTVRSKDPDAVSVAWSQGSVSILSTRSVSVTTVAVDRVSYASGIDEALTNLAGAMNYKADKSALDNHEGNTNNPHKVTAEQVGAATQEDVSTAADSAVATASAYTDGQTTPLWSYLGAENFRVVVTNYDSAVHPPVASFEYRMTTNEAFRTVWNETNGLNRAIVTATNLAHQAAKQLIDDPANRAWGKYDSETGEASPEGVIQATAPGGLIVGGGQRWSQISAESGWWILTSTDPTLCRTGTNGVFSIIGSDGQEAIRIVKGSKVTVPAPADSISVASGVCTVTYAVEAEQHPTAQFASKLGGDAGTVWYNEGDADCPVTMTWSGTSGNYVLTFDTAGLSAGFIQATYEQGQESYTSFGGAGLELTKIRIGGKVYTVGTATIDGKTVLTLQ